MHVARAWPTRLADRRCSADWKAIRRLNRANIQKLWVDARPQNGPMRGSHGLRPSLLDPMGTGFRRETVPHLSTQAECPPHIRAPCVSLTIREKETAETRDRSYLGLCGKPLGFVTTDRFPSRRSRFSADRSTVWPASCFKTSRPFGARKGIWEIFSMSLGGPCLFAILVVVQVLGLASVVLARLTENSAFQALCQRLFVACLLVVGGVTVLAFQSGSGGWFSCAATLPVMALGATLDMKRSYEYAAF